MDVSRHLCRPDPTRSDRIRPDPTASDRKFWDPHRWGSDRIRPDPTGPDRIRPDPTGPDRIRPDPTAPFFMGLWGFLFSSAIYYMSHFFLFCCFLKVPPGHRGPRGARGDTPTVGQLLETSSEVLILGIIPLKKCFGQTMEVGKGC